MKRVHFGILTHRVKTELNNKNQRKYETTQNKKCSRVKELLQNSIILTFSSELSKHGSGMRFSVALRAARDRAALKSEKLI